MSRLMKLSVLAAALVSLGYGTQAEAGIPDINMPLGQSDFGGVGLLQTPTARMNRVGEFSVNYSDVQEYRRMAVNLQLFPWLETTARYTDIRYRLYSQDPGFSGYQTYKDKGFDAKLLLTQESYWMPQIALGLRDMGGTGLFAGEFLVANKRFGDFDVSLGMGWGYLGQRDNIPNPFCEIADRMCERPTGFSGRGGKFEVDQWFRGPAAVFGGVNYRSPVDGLNLQLEYDGNDYQSDNAGRPIAVDSPWNVGASYQMNDNVTFRLGYQRGNTLSFGFTLNYNFTDAYQVKIEPKKREAKSEQSAAQTLNDVDIDKLSQSLWRESGFSVQAAAATDNTVTLYGFQGRYRDMDEALDRAARVLADELPEDIRRYEIAELGNGFALAQHNIDADVFKMAYRGERFHRETEDAVTTGEVRRGVQPFYRVEQDPGFSWYLDPDLEQSFGGPESFYIYQLSVLARGNYRFTDNFSVHGTAGINIINNFDKFNFLIDNFDSPVPRVRTRVREYIVNQDLWLHNLQATYTHQFSNDWYGVGYAGYLERMFAGAGGELLYRPLRSNVAFGVDVNYVRQREPGSEFAVEDYDVLTGHASVYWDLPYIDDSVLIVRGGRFLAGDYGTHLEFKRIFDSGVVAGAYAAFTNLSAEEYGEGSFTKGFYLSIPVDLFLFNRTRSRAGLAWSPLMRDGGQMLYRSRQLYYMTQPRD